MYVNVGSHDKTISGFINLDLEPLGDVCGDVTHGLPLRAGSVEGIYSEHFIEHLHQHDAVQFFRECRRVLRPGGIVRVATPDLRALVTSYLSDGWRTGDLFDHGYDHVQTAAEKLNIEFRDWGHRWMFDEIELSRLGRVAGLALLGRCEWGRSHDPAMSGLEYRPGSDLVVEFRNPIPTEPVGDPLVSVLIPAYRATYLDEALWSARSQTWAALEILVGDDCPDASVRELVDQHAREDDRITLVPVGPGAGSLRNYLTLFEHASGEYVKYLNDDDLLAPECIERQARCLQRLPHVTLVTSHRQRIDEHGNPLPDDLATLRPVPLDAIIPGPDAIGDVLRRRVNWIGEPTTAMFRRRDIDDAEPSLFAFAGRPARANVDVTLWARLLSRGDLAYLCPSLSSFRQHAEQEQRTYEDFARVAHEAWEQICGDGFRMGLVARRQREARHVPLELRPWWPLSTEADVCAADVALQEGRVDEALTFLDAAHGATPDDSTVGVLRARLHAAAGDANTAMQILVVALEADPQDVPALLALAELAEHIGQRGDAKSFVARAASLVPANRSLRSRLDGLSEPVTVSNQAC